MMRVVPIDIDFAGWTEVEEGEHNAWGVIDSEGNLLSRHTIHEKPHVVEDE